MTNPVGRPTAYGPEVIEVASAYLEDEDVIAPNLAELSRKLGVSRATIYNWRDANPEFLDIVEQILSEQEARLIKGGLSGALNSTITKLLLAKHGYHDKQDNTHSGPEGGPVQVIERTIIRTTDTNS
ncbi:MAG: terminase small subunit [Candidatus Thorarchaeota archaeon]